MLILRLCNEMTDRNPRCLTNHKLALELAMTFLQKSVISRFHSF